MHGCIAYVRFAYSPWQMGENLLIHYTTTLSLLPKWFEKNEHRSDIMSQLAKNILDTALPLGEETSTPSQYDPIRNFAPDLTSDNDPNTTFNGCCGGLLLSNEICNNHKHDADVLKQINFI